MDDSCVVNNSCIRCSSCSCINNCKNRSVSFGCKLLSNSSTTLYPGPGWNCPAVDRLTAFFDELEDRLDYRHWYYGHFHRDANPAECHTVLYDCIVRLGDELQPWDVA